MIEKIAGTELYLYQGRIVDLAFLQSRVAELQSAIAGHSQVAESIKLIDCEGLSDELKEAAYLYNQSKLIDKEAIEASIELFDNELNLIEQCQ